MTIPSKRSERLEYDIGFHQGYTRKESIAAFCIRNEISVPLYYRIRKQTGASYLKGATEGMEQREAEDAADQKAGRDEMRMWLSDRDAQIAKRNGDIDPLLK